VRAAQTGVAALCCVSFVGQVMLTFFWKVGAPQFPVLLAVFVMGNVVADLTYFVAFPLITVHYGGWLIAPIRAGTDLGGLLTAVLGQLQAPEGGGGAHTFNIAFMSGGFAILTGIGLAAWIVIVSTRSGLRDVEAEDSTSSSLRPSLRDNSFDPRVASMEFGGSPTPEPSALKKVLQGFICPRSLVVPVVLATLSQVNYWVLGANAYIVASTMLNAPGHCDDPSGSVATQWGAKALRIATTVNFSLVPVGSVLSSLGRCPRPLFYCLFAFQSLCALALCCCLFGVGRDDFWTNHGEPSEIGRNVYIAAYGLVGFLEGYLLTMAYRYCGDDEGVPEAMRGSASKLLSLLGVVAVNVPNIFIGILLDNGTIACQ